MGVWQLDMVDSAMSFTGVVHNLSLKVDAVKNLSLIGAKVLMLILSQARARTS